MDLEFLKSFIATVDFGSITRTSEEKHLTVSAISKRIAKLEEELGVKLFEQKGKLLYPTLSAAEVLPYARKMVMLYENLIENIRVGSEL